MIKLILLAMSLASVAGAMETVVFGCAHPDDLIPCAGLGFLMEGKFEKHVIDFTHGERGCGEAKFRDGSTKAERTREEASACALLNAKLHWLNEVDGDAYASREACAAAARLLKEINPRALFIHWPIDEHLDHAMSSVCFLKAVALAGIKPEIYFFDECYQSKGFHPTHYVDITTVIDKRTRLIQSYTCQNPEQMTRNHNLDSRANGFRMVPSADYAEVFSAYLGNPQGTRCIFTELDKPKYGAH